jgi:hypothetical protein
MANKSISLPVPAGDGVGAAVDATILGANKTIICGGSFPAGVITVEMSQDGSNWAPLCTMTQPGKAFKIGCCAYMRARSQGVQGSPSIDVGAGEDQVGTATLAVPAGDGVGASSNVEELGNLATVIVGGSLDGTATITIEGSQDDADYAPLGTFPDPGSGTINASVRFMRARVSGYNAAVPFSPVVTMGVVLGGGGGGGGTAVLAENLTQVARDSSSFGVYTEHVINVRPGGDDVNGDGSLGNPYATLLRALQDVPMAIKEDTTYAIDMTGMGLVTVSNSIDLSNYIGDSYPHYDYTNNWRAYHGALTIQAEPTVIDTIEASDVTGVVTDPDSTLKTLQTTKSWAPGSLKGLIAIGPSGSFTSIAIADNTATDIKLCTRYTPSYPLQIVEPSCELVADSSAYQIFSIWNNKCSIAFCGIKLTGYSNAWGNSFTTFGGNEYISGYGAFFSAFRVGGYATSNNGTMRMVGCAIVGDGSQQSGWKSAWDDFYNCYFEAVRRDEVGYHEPTFNEIQQACIMDGCDPFGIGYAYNDIFTGAFVIYKCEIRNGLNDGVQALSCGFASMLKDVLIENCVGDAVYARGPVYLDLADVGGSGNGGIGVKLTNGATAYHRWGTDVTGAGGDYQVGSNPAAAGGGAGWAAFAGPGFENDLGAIDPQLCRMFTVLNP